MKTSGKCQTENHSFGSNLDNAFNYLTATFVRTIAPRRTRRKKPEEDLKTAYYYRHGQLKIEKCDNSSLGLYLGKYIFIKKYSVERDQFLIEDTDGEQTWTDFIVPIRPSINGYDIYHTCFRFLANQNLKEGQTIWYRTKNNFAYLKTEHQTMCDEFVLYKDGRLNIDHIPKCFNFALGYSENDAVATILDEIVYSQNKMNTSYVENT
jgi:hypothetical protein